VGDSSLSQNQGNIISIGLITLFHVDQVGEQLGLLYNEFIDLDDIVFLSEMIKKLSDNMFLKQTYTEIASLIINNSFDF